MIDDSRIMCSMSLVGRSVIKHRRGGGTIPHFFEGGNAPPLFFTKFHVKRKLTGACVLRHSLIMLVFCSSFCTPENYKFVVNFI